MGYIIRNERYGGTSFNQKDGEFYRFNHDVFSTIVKFAVNKELTIKEKNYLMNMFPDLYSGETRETKIKFDIKEKLYSQYDIPIVSESPEFVDLSLGTACNLSCPFCYTSSGIHGDQISMPNFKLVMNQLAENRVYQVAIGGGEPTYHPNFIEIIKTMKENYDIIPNYTTNGTLLTPEIIKLSSDLCGGVALSYHSKREKELLKIMKRLSDGGVNTILHIIASKSNLPNFANIVEKFSKAGMNAVAFLLFKPAGRGKRLKKEIITLDDINSLDEQFKKSFDISQEFKTSIGFDSCLAPYLANFSDDKIKKGTYDSCTGARVSAFIDWDLSVKPCSFMQDKSEKGESLHEKTLHEIWWGEYFDNFRRKLLKAEHPSCKQCKDFLSCFGGCPIMPEIVLCEKKIIYETKNSK